MIESSAGYRTPFFDDPHEHDIFVRGCKAGLGMAAADLDRLAAEYKKVGMYDIASVLERAAHVFANPKVTIVHEDHE